MPNPFPPALIQAPVNTFLLTDKIVGVRPSSFEGLQNTVRGVIENAGIVRVLAASGAKISNTGNTTENTLATISVPASAMGPNGFVRVTSLWTTTANTNTKTCVVKFNGTAFTSFSHTTAAHLTTQAFSIIQNRNSLASQIGQALSNYGSGAGVNAAQVTSTHDTSGALNITLTAQCVTSGTDTIDLERYIVEVCYVA